MTYVSRFLAFMRVNKANTPNTRSHRALVCPSHWGLVLLLVTYASGLSTACLLPPDEGPPIDSYAPRPQSVFPIEPLIRTRIIEFTPDNGSEPSTDCFIQLRVSDIVDFDSPDLQARVVLNNNLPGARFIADPSVSNGEVNINIPVNRLELVETEPESVAIVSLFISDGDNWISNFANTLNYGRDVSDEAEIVEIRWTVQFSQSGECRSGE